MKKYSTNDAIAKSAVMIHAQDWLVFRGYDPKVVGPALVLVLRDCWSDKLQDEAGNGFLGVPKDRSDEVLKEHGALVASVYRMFIKANINARKSYIRNNPELKKLIDKVLGISSRERSL